MTKIIHEANKICYFFFSNLMINLLCYWLIPSSRSKSYPLSYTNNSTNTILQKSRKKYIFFLLFYAKANLNVMVANLHDLYISRGDVSSFYFTELSPKFFSLVETYTHFSHFQYHFQFYISRCKLFGVVTARSSKCDVIISFLFKRCKLIFNKIFIIIPHIIKWV